MLRRQELQRTDWEILLPEGERVSTLYKDDFPGGQGPTLLTLRSVWWGTRDMVFRADRKTGKREVYLPWAGAQGAVLGLALDGDLVRVQTESGERRIRPDATEFDGFVRARLGSESAEPESAKARRVAAEVEQWLGTPYLYGGMSRAGCDCSGFVCAMARVGGVSLPRTSAAIAKTGVPVRGELRFGDVICTPGHVALYLGNGWQVEAPQSGDVVKKTTIWHRAGASARRIFRSG